MTEANKKKDLSLVQVFVRERPLTSFEKDTRRPKAIKSKDEEHITIKSGAVEKKYVFDRVFGYEASQKDVYELAVKPLIDLVLSGYTCSIFAYGQTGTGKTHTMIGPNISLLTDFTNDNSVGMIPRAAVDIFSALSRSNGTYVVRVSFIEIYNEEVRDLLVTDCPTLRIYEDPQKKSTCIKDLSEVPVTNVKELYDMLVIGNDERETASTLLNRHSSRSHTIFTIIVYTREVSSDEEITKTGKLHLIDLAGSENIGRSGATDMRAREAGTINRSLLTLGRVINALAQKLPHVPYRESKLTRILQESLGGKSKTCMIATFAPCVDNFDETLSTLDYANMARSVATCPTVNINKKKSSVVKELRVQLDELRQQLVAARTGSGFYLSQKSYEELVNEIKFKTERLMNLITEVTRLREIENGVKEMCDEVEQSFQTTSRNLETATKELQEESKKEQEIQTVMKQVDERLEDVSSKAHDLLNVFEISKKHTDIYHKKYENLCMTTIHNANIVKNIKGKFDECLEGFQNSREQFSENSNTCLLSAKENASNIKENQLEGLNQLNQVSDEVTSFSKEVTFDSIFKNNSYAEKDVQAHLEVTYSDLVQFMKQKLQEKENTVNEVDKITLDRTASMVKKSNICSTRVKQQVAKEEESNKKLHTIFTQQEHSLDKQISINEQKLDSVKEQIALYKKLNETSKKKKKTLVVELESKRQFRNALDEMILTLKQRENIGNLGQTVTDVRGCLEPSKKLKSIIQTAAHTIGKNEVETQEAIESHKTSTQAYYSGFFGSFKSELDFHNKECSMSCVAGLNGVNTMRELQTVNVEHSKHFIDSVQSVRNNEAVFSSNVKQFVKTSIDEGQKLADRVELTVHANDTPAKLVYNYPKTIEKRFPLIKPQASCSSHENEVDTLVQLHQSETSEADGPPEELKKE